MGLLAVFVGNINESNRFLQFSLLWFGLNTVMIPLQQNLVMHFKKDAKTGNQLTGLYNALLMLGKIVGALATSYVYSKSPASSFAVSGILLFVGLLMMLIQRKVKKI